MLFDKLIMNIKSIFNKKTNVFHSTLLPCPFCGNDLNKQDIVDTIYPVGKLDSLFQIVCQDNAGGCTATVLGNSPKECIKRWNTRK